MRFLLRLSFFRQNDGEFGICSRSLQGETFVPASQAFEVVRSRASGHVQVVALAMPGGDSRTDQLSAYVEPILREEAISSDSADVSVISSATYTMDRAISGSTTEAGSDT